MRQATAAPVTSPTAASRVATRNGSRECGVGANPIPMQTAAPVAPPSWSAARWTPEAIPASSSAVPLTATYWSPTMPNPIAAAIRSMAGIIATPPACRAEASAIAAIAAAVSPMPASTHARAPQRPSRRGTSMENTRAAITARSHGQRLHLAVTRDRRGGGASETE